MSLNVTVRFALVATAAAGVFFAVSPLRAAEKKPKFTVEEVMEKFHKGDDAPIKRVQKGEATKAELKQMVEYYDAMTLAKPEKGEQKSWDEKTKALLASAKDVEAGKAGALDKFKQAVNCKACHSAHKPD